MKVAQIIILLAGFFSRSLSFGQPTCPVEGSAVIDPAYNPMARINDLITSHPDQTYQVEGIELFSTGESIVSLRTFEFGSENQSKSRMVKFNADGTIQCFVFGCSSFITPARKFLINSQQHVVLARDGSEGGFRLLIIDGVGNLINGFPAITGAVGNIVHAIEYQPDGKVVISYDLKVRRVNVNGTFDSSFPTLNIEARVIHQQPDGKLLIGGNFPGGLIRVLPNGDNDPTFQNNNVMGIVNDLVTLPDGKILIVGAFNAVGGFQRNSIALLNADGSTDSSFDSGTGIGLDNNHFIKWVKRMANGKFLIGGTFATYNDIARSGLAMVNTDGSLDCYFKAPQPLSGLVDDAVEQADGKIILTGSFVEYGGVTRKGMVRITPGGPLIPPSGLRLWLRADDLNLPNNAPVSAWNDASGAGNHFGIGGSGAPVYKAACPGVLNGKPYITWNGPGVTSWFARNDALGMAPNTPRTYIAVYRLFNTSARSFVLQHGNFSTPGTYHGIDANTFLTQGNRFGVYSTNSSFDSDRSTDGLFHIQYRSASTMAVNADIINDTEYRINDTLRILTRRSGNGFYESFAGANEFRIGGWIEIAEVIVYDRTLSESERIGIHNYLRNKYGNFPITPAPAPPTISSFSPASAAPGATVTISGSDFTGVTNVSFGGVPATSFTVVSATTITATVPTGATSGRITVNTACNAATSDIDFAVLAGPLFPSVSFAQTASRATGPTPREVLMSDLNGDGFLDVATSLVGSGQLQVFNGTGAGCFNATQNFPTLADGHGLAIDDFNADGRPDVAVSSPNQNQLAVLLNSPTGLQAPTIYTTGAAGALPRHINTGDINGDARPDIVVANSTSPGRFSILYNLGAGVFAAGVDFSTSQGPVYFVSIADFNRDGRQDVVMANFFFGSVSIFINDGAGSFLTERVITLRNGTHFVVARDLNGDGAPDIAAANASNNSVSVLLNQGDGNFLTPVHYATGGYPTSIAVGDLHNDGSLDLTVAHAFGGSFGVLPGNGLGEFGPRQDFSVSGQPYSVALGDITGDGFLDVVATDLSGNRLNFYLSSAFAAPAAPTVTPATACAGTSATLVASGGSAGQYRWYTDATGPTLVPGEVNSNLVTSPLSTTTTFFVALRIGACESSRTPVTATVVATPVPPVANPVSICTGTAATITASGGSTGQYRWYTQATGGTAIAGETNATFTTPTLTSSANYYVALRSGNCESARTEVVVTLNNCSDLVFYNAVSANADALNSYFHIGNVDATPETRANWLRIFNRWGDLVFEVRNYDNVTNRFVGLNNKDDELPTGTYFYVLEFDSGRPKAEGFISLKR